MEGFSLNVFSFHDPRSLGTSRGEDENAQDQRRLLQQKEARRGKLVIKRLQLSSTHPAWYGLALPFSRENQFSDRNTKIDGYSHAIVEEYYIFSQ